MNNPLTKREAMIVDVHGHRMFLNPDDKVISSALSLHKVWEPLETQVVRDEIKNGDTVLDLGANIGYYTLLFAKLVGEKGTVLAFEPDPENYDMLQRNIATNGYRNVIAIPKAVSNETGILRLYLSPENKGDHRICSSHDGRDSIPIESVRLDDYFAKSGCPVDFIKMDIQGAEGRAIQGMALILERNPGLKILSEFWPAGLTRSGVAPGEYLELLLEHGFKLYHVDEEERVAETVPAALLTKYSVSSERFTTLFCTREKWRGEFAYPTWAEQVHRSLEEIKSLVRTEETLILVDHDQLRSGVSAQRHTTPFLERSGEYWGPPLDDGTAIREFERLEEAGACFIVFAWPCFWWLDHYAGFHQYLRANYRCALENERLIVFDLRRTAVSSQAVGGVPSSG